MNGKILTLLVVSLCLFAGCKDSDEKEVWFETVSMDKTANMQVNFYMQDGKLYVDEV